MLEYSMYLSYRYRLYPNEEQRVLLQKHFGACRWFYNYALAKKIAHYQKTGKTLSRYDIQKELPKLKRKGETNWLKETNSQSLQSELRFLDTAYTKFFREKKGFPKFKSRGRRDRFAVPQKFRIEGTRLVIPKFQEGVRIVLSRPLGGEAKSALVSYKSGRYWVSIMCEITTPKKVRSELADSVGLDMGLKDLVVDSNGKKHNVSDVSKAEKRLARALRQLSRSKKGSENRKKRIGEVGRLYRIISDKKADGLHKITTQLVKANGTVCIEDLNVEGMRQNRHLSRAISGAMWGTLRQQLEYKAELYGKNVLTIGRFEPSSKSCTCGYIYKELKLSERKWKCPECGLTHDRDVLAANNIRRFAFNKQNTVRHTGL